MPVYRNMGLLGPSLDATNKAQFPEAIVCDCEIDNDDSG